MQPLLLVKRVMAQAILVLIAFNINAQNKKINPSAALPATNTATATNPKPYREIITARAVTKRGLFTVHRIDDKYYFEIGDSLIGKDMLVVNRISKAPADTRSGFFGYAGDEINKNVIRFEKGPRNKLFLRTISYSVYARDSLKPMYRSVMNSNIQPITAAFDIKALATDSTGSVIEMTDFLNSDNDIFFFSSSVKSALKLTSLQADKSYIEDIRSYPINTEIRTVKTYGKSMFPRSAGAAGTAGPSAGNATFELNSSIVLLPSVPMRPRYYDDRVAYITTEFTDFDADPQGVKDISLITRWRLDIKPEDIPKFNRGELVQPVKPIVYYIDPSTPSKWVPYLIQGVNDWQKAFEKAGFKNAIMAKVAPTREQDSTWSLEDARYSAIVYKPSDIPNAQGPHIHDPRSGEILESHINWFHNVMKLLRNWYIIQAGAIDPRARRPVFSDELMGELIRFVSSHEVGHTLGLPHNMGASSSIPVERLRDKKWVEANGHTPSIMDYARFNYVAQPEDSIEPSGIYPRIGVYDLWAIEWGYKPFPGKTEKEEKKMLNAMVKAKATDSTLRFLHIDGMDPRAQTEDLGDNAVKAGEYGIKNLKRILPQLPKWLNEDGENYQTLEEVYDALLQQWSRYMGHAITCIGGIKTDSKTTEQEGQVYTIVPKADQKKALAFIRRELLETPTWLMNKNILDNIKAPTGDRIGTIQDNFLGSLLSSGRLLRLIAEHNRDAGSYSIDEYMADLSAAIFSELSTRKPIDNYRRNLQKSFVERLIGMIDPSRPSPPSGGGITITIGPVTDPQKTDIVSVARETLRKLNSRINSLLLYPDKMSRYHLQDIHERIEDLNSKQ